MSNYEKLKNIEEKIKNIKDETEEGKNLKEILSSMIDLMWFQLMDRKEEVEYLFLKHFDALMSEFIKKNKKKPKTIYVGKREKDLVARTSSELEERHSLIETLCNIVIVEKEEYLSFN